jgi:predicted RNA-binding Zn-ribbon protein involved in translation (DUF1610 family)
MGMFDSVWVNCPKCGSVIQFQSKAGECALIDYGLNDAPPRVLGSLDGDTETCPDCGSVIIIRVSVLAIPYVCREPS